MEHTFLLLDGEQSATSENYISFKIQHAPVSRDHYIAAYMRLQGRKRTLLNADLPTVLYFPIFTQMRGETCKIKMLHTSFFPDFTIMCG